MSRITDQGPAHTYFTQIPNTIIKGVQGRDLSLSARWLYVYLKSVAGEGGVCNKGARTIARESQLSSAAIVKAKAELVKKGLIAREVRERGSHQADRITITDIWPANMAEFAPTKACAPVEDASTPNEQSPPNCFRSETDTPVHCFINEADLFQKENGSVLEVKQRNIPLGRSPEEEEEGEAAPAPPPAPVLVGEVLTKDPITPAELITLYNTQTPDHLSKVEALTPGRLANVQAILATFPERAFWTRVCAAVAASPFLCGQRPGKDRPPFHLTFDWLIEPKKDRVENCVKVVEGHYADTIMDHAVQQLGPAGVRMAAQVNRMLEKRGFHRKETTCALP